MGGHDRLFYFWPFFIKQDNRTGTEDPEKFRAVFPFYVTSHSPKRDFTGVLWPFFASVDDRVKKYHEWQGPWPFVIFTRGEGKHTSRVFPLFSESRNESQEVDSYLWPIYQFKRKHAESFDQRRTRLCLYLYSRLWTKNM
jgi:hypothetical protein